MEIIFLGSGSFFSIASVNYHSNILIRDPRNKKYLLLDCGYDIRHSLHEQGFTYKEITDIYISHLHGDHAGGLEYIGFSHRFSKGKVKPNLFVSEHLETKLWENCLSGSMSTLEDEKAALDTYFCPNVISDKDKNFHWNGIDFELVQADHTMNDKFVNYCYGLFFTLNETDIYLTSDTKFRPDLYMDYYKKADLIFHDCEVAENRSGVHSNYKDLLTLPEDIRKKLWLYHYDSEHLPSAEEDGMKGFVKKGQRFSF